MIKFPKTISVFNRNILFVFLGTSLTNVFNLLYQLLIAHRLSPPDFAAFNSLLSIFMLVSSPLSTLHTTIVKYTSELNAQEQAEKVRFLLSRILRKALILSFITFFIFYFASSFIMKELKIPSISAVYILSILLALSWVIPVFSGGLQGLELFKWLMSSSVISGAIKLLFAFVFIFLGFNIAGALGALLISILIGIAISFFPLKNFLFSKAISGKINLKEIFFYLFPVAISSFCFIALVSFDMVMVKYYFLPRDSGTYSLAQMVGKIFLFLPGAITIVMFPKVSGLDAKKMDTTQTLRESILYASILSLAAVLFYNIFPSFVLKTLTGKVFPESIILGRLFSISMSFFTLVYIFINYFLSKKDLRFIKYLFLSVILQFSAIAFFHKNLIQIQLILCTNALLLLINQLVLSDFIRFYPRREYLENGRMRASPA